MNRKVWKLCQIYHEECVRHFLPAKDIWLGKGHKTPCCVHLQE